MNKVTPLSLRHKLALELSHKPQNEKIEKHPLRQLFWECTLRCNLHCRHCGSDCKQLSAQPDMPFNDFAKALDSIAAKVDPHQVFVILTGGEPLMRKDLEQCGKAIYEKGFPWGMVTNGLFLTKERFLSLLNAGLHSATVSLDGMASEHNWMRGNSESFERATNAIRMMAQMPDFVFDVVTCVNKRNIHQLNEIKEYLLSLGVKHWRVFTIFPTGRAAMDPDLQLSNDEFRKLMEYIRLTRKERQIDLSYGCEGFLGNYEGEVRNYFFMCSAGISVGSVLIDGSISACPSIRADYRQGNIYQDDFMQAWETRFLPYRSREWMRKDECTDCKYFRYCRGNGMHLRDENGKLMFCHLKRLQEK